MKKEQKKVGCGTRAAILIVLLIAAIACFAVLGSYLSGRDAKMGGDASAPTSSDVPAEEEKAVLYDGADMTVTFGSLEDGGPAGMGILSLIVENKTDKDVNLVAEQGTLVVNGYNIDSLGGAEIQAGNKAVAQIMLSFKQANISNLDEIKTVSMNLEMITLGATVDVVAAAPVSLEF
ncbi:MAG: hypothetical protein HFJ75_07535 [Eggerthellaceae bacterium]|nr:hypothetical protein [Eggerthellaceae bacterium]